MSERLIHRRMTRDKNFTLARSPTKTLVSELRAICMVQSILTEYRVPWLLCGGRAVHVQGPLCSRMHTRMTIEEAV
jgi:hypothetical protein